MTAPIALQLYTLREALKEDFSSVVRKIARMGYAGVEPAGFSGTTPEKAGALFKELGLAVPSAHTPLPLGEDKNRVLEEMLAIDCQRIIAASPPEAAEDYRTLDHVRQACDLFNRANAVAREHGLRFGVHNHWREFEKVDGRYVYQVLLECLEPDVFFQIDTYWVKTAGPDPVTVIKELGARAPLLHIKDGPCIRDEPQVAVGDGLMDIPAIVQASSATTEWLIVEIDDCSSDMLEAVEKSYRYLVGEGLARGKLS